MVSSASDNGQTLPQGPAVGDRPASRRPLSGDELFAALAAAGAYLRESARAVDAINVYPVPDGDTGSNMAATFREAIDTAATVPEPRAVGDVLVAVAKGALYGARGNSGVILSQALRGLSDASAGYEAFDAAALAAGLSAAAAASYRAVSKPVEGTMLTVLRAAGEAAEAHVKTLPDGGQARPCLATLLAALTAAEEAEAHTPEQLPELAEAGVTDAGGEGICVILRGLAAALAGERPPAPAMPEQPIADLAGHAHESFGYCTEFVLEPHDGALDVEGVRAWATGAGHRSVVVVGTAEAARVHLHADDGQAALAAAGTLGRVSRAKVEDMGAQHLRFRSTGSGAGKRLAVLALSRGEGIDRLFESMGAAVADLGDIVKPPAGDIAAAADALNVADVIVLTNHKNVVMAARQAAELTRCTLHVVETTSLPQGLAAAFAFDPDKTTAENQQAMTRSATGVATVEVTTAAAERVVDGVEVRRGQAIALLDGTLVAARESAVEALVAGLAEAGAASAGLISIFAGQEATDDLQRAVEVRVREEFPEAEVEMQPGGQPLYTFVAGVEQ